jgi:succinate dehydrogenase / fumarate reductase membrane anchor subunit
MGVKQWIFQRASNALVVLFGLWLLATLINGVTSSTLNDALTGDISRVFLVIVLVAASLNSILAGWQIAGDYAHKIGMSEKLMTAVGAAISLAYLALGLKLII